MPPTRTTSESRRGLARIATNYSRLALTLAFGLVQIPILYTGLGKDAFGVWGLLISTGGIAGMFREVVMRGLNRELGEAFHSGSDSTFRETFRAACVVCAGLTAGAALLFAAMIAIVPLFNVPDHLVAPARWALVGRGLFTCVVLCLTPTINILIVSERMTLHNAWVTIERAAPLTVAVVLFPVLAIDDPGRGLTLFGLWSGAGMGAIAVLAAAAMIALDRRTIPTLGRAARGPLRSILTTGGWNAAVTVALNLHLRLANIILNLAFNQSTALTLNSVYTIAIQLTSYARMATVGMTDGLDAVAARLSTTESTLDRLRRLSRASTRLHALVALPAALAIGVLVEPLLMVWVADRFENPDVELPLAVATIRLLALGMAARSVSDGWIRLLYGAGYVSRYAPLILVGGLGNPVLAIALIIAAKGGLLPDSIAFYAPAIAYSAIFIVVHVVLLSRIAGRCLEESTAQTLAPIGRPLFITLLASPMLWLPGWLGITGDWLVILGAGAGYTGVFAPLAWFVVLSAGERQRIARKLLGRGAEPDSD
ncbi:MAG: hypothetical protein ACF8Q5_10405 [Phycisphaerales bacterium JB040]